jgi:hypothetical protein
MTLYEFNAVEDGEEKLLYVLINGEYIGFREVEGQKISVYQLPAFYVEILPATDGHAVLLCKAYEYYIAVPGADRYFRVGTTRLIYIIRNRV